MGRPLEHSLRLRTATLRNFRGFEHLDARFAPEFTVVIGDNGSGKSSLLDALALALSAFFEAFDEIDGEPVDPQDIRRVGFTYGTEVTFEAQLPLGISCTGDGQEGEISWELTLEKSIREPLHEAPWRFAEEATWALESQEQVRSGEPVVLPLLGYYGTGRLFHLEHAEESLDPLPPGSRLEGYRDAFAAGANVTTLVQWLKTQELISLQEDGAGSALEAVKAAVRSCMPDFGNVFYSVRHDTLVASQGEDDASARTFATLSDGYRNVLAMVADLARRAAVLNPQLGAAAAAQTPGIVLIDELDLHLHPSWQRRIVDDLRRTFPKLQFIATTHSPFIIQSLRPGELLHLSVAATEASGEVDTDLTASEYVDRSIEDIAEGVMGVENVERSERFHTKMQLAEAYFAALDAADGDIEASPAAQARLDELVAEFGDDPSFAALLKLQQSDGGE